MVACLSAPHSSIEGCHNVNAAMSIMVAHSLVGITEMIWMPISGVGSAFQEWSRLVVAMKGCPTELPGKQAGIYPMRGQGILPKRLRGPKRRRWLPLFYWHLNASQCVLDCCKVWGRLRWFLLQTERFLTVSNGIRGLLWCVQTWVRLASCKSWGMEMTQVMCLEVSGLSVNWYQPSFGKTCEMALASVPLLICWSCAGEMLQLPSQESLKQDSCLESPYRVSYDTSQDSLEVEQSRVFAVSGESGLFFSSMHSLEAYLLCIQVFYFVPCHGEALIDFTKQSPNLRMWVIPEYASL